MKGLVNKIFISYYSFSIKSKLTENSLNEVPACFFLLLCLFLPLQSIAMLTQHNQFPIIANADTGICAQTNGLQHLCHPSFFFLSWAYFLSFCHSLFLLSSLHIVHPVLCLVLFLFIFSTVCRVYSSKQRIKGCSQMHQYGCYSC